MIEIAIALAVIGFALVAIIGILPMGLNVQKETRERTIINQDAMYFLDALKNGVQQLDELTNFVFKIQHEGAATPFTFGNGNGFIDGYEIIGLLTRPDLFTTTYVHAITGSAVDRSIASRDLSFGYRLNVHMALVQNTATNEFNDPDPVNAPSWIVTNIQNRLWDIRLVFAWPLRSNGQVGRNRAVYRALAAGVMVAPETNGIPSTSPFLFIKP